MVYFLCKAYDSGRQNCYFALSLPARGATVLRRSPCGERGLKWLPIADAPAAVIVAPRAGSVG